MALIGIDHVVLAVDDLEGSARALGAALGIEVHAGGAHPGWGTHNAIAWLGDGYLELITVADADQAGQVPQGRRLIESLRRGTGWLGYALAVDDLDRTLDDLRARGVSVGPPTEGRRLRPDGAELRWRLAGLDPELWGGTLPFLIQHDTPLAVRRASADHALAAGSCKALGVAVRRLEDHVPAYEALFGDRARYDHFSYVRSKRASWKLPDGAIVRLMAPDEPGVGPAAAHLESRGEGLFVVGYAVPDVDAAIHDLRGRGTTVSDPQPGRAAFVEPAATLGARFALVETRARAA